MTPVEVVTLFCLAVYILSVCFVLYRKKADSSTTVMLLALLCISYTQAVLLSHSFPRYKILNYLVYTDAVVFYFTMPLFYMFVLKVTRRKPFLKPSNGINLLPSLPGIVYLVYFNWLSPLQREICLSTKTCGILDDNWLYALGLTSQSIFIVLSIIALNKHLKRNQRTLAPSSIKKYYVYTWTMYVIVVVAAGLTSLALLFESVRDVHQVGMLFMFVTFAGFYAMACINYLCPEKVPAAPLAKKEKRAAMGFNGLENRIAELMQKREVFRDRELSLNSFSKALNEPPYKVSACLRQSLQTSFPDFINTQRVRYAEKMFRDEKNKSMKMEYVAINCGFNSRSSFYNLFKKHTGMTPAEYLENNCAATVADHHKVDDGSGIVP